MIRGRSRAKGAITTLALAALLAARAAVAGPAVVSTRPFPDAETGELTFFVGGINESGRSLRAAVDLFKLPLKAVVVIHDELDLPAAIVLTGSRERRRDARYPQHLEDHHSVCRRWRPARRNCAFP